jgi:hypothetical protein
MASADWIPSRHRSDRWRLAALRLTGSLNWLFAALALGLIVYVVVLTAAIVSGAWFGRERTIKARR